MADLSVAESCRVAHSYPRASTTDIRPAHGGRRPLRTRNGPLPGRGVDEATINAASIPYLLDPARPEGPTRGATTRPYLGAGSTSRAHCARSIRCHLRDWRRWARGADDLRAPGDPHRTHLDHPTRRHCNADVTFLRATRRIIQHGCPACGGRSPRLLAQIATAPPARLRVCREIGLAHHGETFADFVRHPDLYARPGLRSDIGVSRPGRSRSLWEIITSVFPERARTAYSSDAARPPASFSAATARTTEDPRKLCFQACATSDHASRGVSPGVTPRLAPRPSAWIARRTGKRLGQCHSTTVG